MRTLLAILLLPFLIIVMIPVGALIFGIGAGIFGAVVGIIGAVFGVIVAFFATIFGGIAALLGLGIFSKFFLVILAVMVVAYMLGRGNHTQGSTKPTK